ncbi:hypothetical protein OUZ56_014522 [Daphnia magna]|uniref:Uncharacterized protein n=1 Tax=Daphnia magna TaxID=35525 RepID=A0ABR0AK03_9CRUS|nr:hypothetical protein OUZ56_014522 [Daphnia magna]
MLLAEENVRLTNRSPDESNHRSHTHIYPSGIGKLATALNVAKNKKSKKKRTVDCRDSVIAAQETIGGGDFIFGDTSPLTIVAIAYYFCGA